LNQESLTTQVQKKLQAKFNSPKDFIEFGSPRGDNRHFVLEIHSESFRGLSRLQRHQMVYGLLDDLIQTGKIHALQLKLKEL